MVASTSDGHFLLVKKLGGLVAIIIGCVLTALGLTFDYASTTTIGVAFLVLGGVLLTLKIIRRNQGNPLG
jgi:hypothetical protein